MTDRHKLTPAHLEKLLAALLAADVLQEAIRGQSYLSDMNPDYYGCIICGSEWLADDGGEYGEDGSILTPEGWEHKHDCPLMQLLMR